MKEKIKKRNQMKMKIMNEIYVKNDYKEINENQEDEKKSRKF